MDVEMKAALHDELRWAREAMLWKLDGLNDYDVRRPLTATGTNLLGLIKYLSMGESKYLGEVFGGPFPSTCHGGTGRRIQRGQVGHRRRARAEIIERYQRVCEHSDTTIDPLDLGALGHVPWWPRPEVTAASSGLASAGAYPSPEADVEG